MSVCLMYRIRSRVVEPYNKIVTRTMQLRRLQVATQFVMCVSVFM